MKWKCNTMGCEKVFNVDMTEKDLLKSSFIFPICSFCKEPTNRSYRVKL